MNNRDKAERLREAGFSYAKIGLMMGFSGAYAQKLCVGVIRSKFPRGQRKGGENIDGNLIQEMRRRGMTWRQVAQHLGCSEGGAQYALKAHERRLVKWAEEERRKREPKQPVRFEDLVKKEDLLHRATDEIHREGD